MRARHPGLVGIALAAVMLVGAAFAPGAGAIEYTYKFGSPLQTLTGGVSIGVLKASDAFPYVFEANTKVIAFKDKCQEALVENASISGGQPATSALTLKFQNCTVSVNGKGCTHISTQSEPLAGEQTEILAPANRAGNPATLYLPVTGNVLFVVKANCGGKEEEFAIEGSVAAQIFGNVPNVVRELEFPGVTWITSVTKFGEEEAFKPGMQLLGEVALMEGATNLKLEVTTVWGAY